MGIEPRKKNICIVGFAPSSAMLAPYHLLGDEDWEFWGINELYLMVPHASKFDKWFQLHMRADNIDRNPRDPKHKDWLKTCKMPVIIQYAHEEIPTSIAYPLKEVQKYFGQNIIKNIDTLDSKEDFNYYTNTISYMIALAIMQKPNLIAVYGVDMAQEQEFGHQRPSCEFFLGYCAGAGIKLYIPPESDLLKTSFLYGFEDEPDWKKKARAFIDEKEAMLNQVTSQIDQLVPNMHYQRGCRDAAKYFLGQR